MSAILERPSLSPSYHVLTPEFSFGIGKTNVDHLRFNLPESDNWLKDYKKTPGSIFKYYSVKNEFDFLKSAEELTPEKQEFYIQENVRRYLGEFVGKVPYTTIRYDMDTQGFTYAGMHMMDSYRKAAEITKRSREYAEVVGFQLIEDAFSNKAAEPNPPTTAKWISPPKDWDYGFEFIFKKGKDGKIVEYILRYPEKRGELIESNKLLHIDHPHQQLNHADDFLFAPIFTTEPKKTDTDLDAVLRKIGIDEQKIAQSHYFEQQIEKVLGGWISEYARRIVGLSKKEKSDVDYEWSIEQAEILLLSIYQQAQEIINMFPYLNNTTPVLRALDHQENLFSQELLGMHALQLQKQKNLPQALGGSCPAIEDAQTTLDPATRFVSNHDVINALKNGKKLEDILNGDTHEKRFQKCTCPGCKHVVMAVIENGTITCPRKSCGNSAPYEC